MVSTRAGKKKIEQSIQKDAYKHCRQLQKKSALFHVVAAAAMVAMHVSSSLTKTPQHTSILSGLRWVGELLGGHPIRFHNMLGMSKHVFRGLASELSQYGGL